MTFLACHRLGTDCAGGSPVQGGVRSFVLCFLFATAALADSVRVISGGTPPLREGALAISPVDSRIVLAAAIGGTGAPRADGTCSDRPTAARHGRRSDLWSRSWRAIRSSVIGTRCSHSTAAGEHSSRSSLHSRELRWTIAVYRSDDNGLTWTGVDAGSPNALRNDKPWIAIDDNDAIHVAWYQFQSGATGLAYAASRDGGLSYAEPRVFALGDGWPYVAVGPDHHVYLTYVSRFSAFDVMRSSDGGATFGEPSRISPYTSFPHQIVVDRSTGPYRHHVYAFVPVPDGVYFTRSTDRGDTWSSLRK